MSDTFIAEAETRPHGRSTAVGAPDQGSAIAAQNDIAVIISTRGRPEIVAELVRQLRFQSKAPDRVFVIASQVEDLAGLDSEEDGVTVHVGRTGLTKQRNDGLALAGSRFTYVVFFDDDFVPSRFWLERAFAIFESDANIAGLTGVLLGDGTGTAGISLPDAEEMVRKRDAHSEMGVQRTPPLDRHFAHGGNMGCNMAYRTASLEKARFDERLPLYAWLEDHDFRGQVERSGAFVRAESLWGVHLGHKPGRLSGVRLGYSQIANAIYLAKKGTVPKGYLAKLAGKNLAINLLRSVRAEPFVDRRGRLRGNLMALRDLFAGRLAPERVSEL